MAVKSDTLKALATVVLRDVFVSHNKETNRYGSVYHKESCGVLARSLGVHAISINKAEELGKSACFFCHRVSTKRWLCPECKDKNHLRLRENDEGNTVLICTVCRFTLEYDPEEQAPVTPVNPEEVDH